MLYCGHGDWWGARMADVAWVPILIGFAGGGVTATLINAAVKHWCRPIISARLVPDIGCYVESGRGNPQTHTAKFLRLQVRNTGLSLLESCAGYITRITKRQNGQVINDQREVLELVWSHQSTAPRDIPRDAFFYIDVAALDRLAAGNNVLSFGRPLPHSLTGLVAGRASFELDILIAAGNAKSFPRKVRFDYDPANAELAFAYDA
jgi:hypothetical protein